MPLSKHYIRVLYNIIIYFRSDRRRRRRRIVNSIASQSTRMPTYEFTIKRHNILYYEPLMIQSEKRLVYSRVIAYSVRRNITLQQVCTMRNAKYSYTDNP